jgi:hypothetical protein
MPLMESRELTFIYSKAFSNRHSADSNSFPWTRLTYEHGYMHGSCDAYMYT